MKDAADRLTPAEQRMVREIVAQPRNAALGTAADLAAMVGVHEATASRLARKLGFETYARFRNALRDEFVARTDSALRMRTTLDDARGSDVLSQLVDREIAALDRITDHIKVEQIEAAATTIHDARTVFMFARGNAQALAVMMERRLQRFGKTAFRLIGDGRDLAEQLLALKPSDVLLAFAFRRQPHLYQLVLERAHEVGATTVAIAGTIGPTLRPAADQLLSAPRSGRAEGFQSLIVPMTICNALVLQIAKHDEKNSLRTLETLGDLIRRFES
ncbi:MAG: MurR/RpiR family transcriptional regulator [Pseudomonadota bacterium]